ncbi:MAG: hypothetical protein GY898_33050 [Proteobacteria bacterium]|nr:hypothetical protein [Pseudomonadota bacterium]
MPSPRALVLLLVLCGVLGCPEPDPEPSDDDDDATDDDDIAPDDDDIAPDDDDDAAPTCADDVYEDNDNGAEPTTLATSSSTTTGLTACPGDDDYFEVFLEFGDTITADILFANADGNLDLGLLDEAGNFVASGTSTTDNESTGAVTVTAAGNY